MVCKTIFSFLLLCLAGCREQTAVPHNPQRILSLSAAATRVLTALGSPAAAVDAYAQVGAPEGTIPVIGKGTAVSREKMAEYGIDCILLWSYQESSFLQEKRAGMRLEVIEPLRLAEYPGFIRKLGKLAGKEREAALLADEFRRKMEKCKKQLPAPLPVYWELYAPWKAAGRESYAGDLLQLSGFRSIVPKTGVIGAEELIESAPQVIFFVEGFTSAREIAGRPGMQTLPAVKNNRIYAVPRRFLVEGLAPLEAIDFLKKKQEL